MLKILIVDDSKTIRKVVRRSLERYGYSDIEDAEDGLCAIKKLESSKFDLIFTDINMPNMNGYELLEWMRREGVLENTEVIAISTEVANMCRNEMKILGVDEAIPKPFSKDEFEKIAISLLGVIENTNKIQQLNLDYSDEIIVTDDSTPMRSVLKRQLKVYGCSNIYEAVHGKEALDIIKHIVANMRFKHKIILFLDLNMPVMDGLELIETLERDSLLECVTIIVLSASLESAKSTVDGVNIIAALPKPFKQKEFSNVFTPLITESLMDKNLSFDSIKLLNIIDKPKDMDDFLDKLFSTIDEQIEFLDGYSGKKMIDYNLFEELDSKIYSNYPNISTHKQKKLLIGMKVLKHLEKSIEDIDKELPNSLFLDKILPIIDEYKSKESEIQKCKKELYEYKMHLEKIENEIKKDTKTKEALKEKREKIKKYLKIKSNSIAKLEIERDEIYSSNYEKFISKYEEVLKHSKEKIRVGLNRSLYRYDKIFWIESRKLEDDTKLKELKWLNAYTFFENIEDKRSAEALKILEFNSILCVGFLQKDILDIKKQLTSNFKDFDISFIQKPDISFYTATFEPNLIIINYSIGIKKIKILMDSIVEKYGILSDDLNILYVIEKELSPKEINLNIAASIFDKNEKNYAKLPDSQPSNLEFCKKAKALIS